MRERKMQNNTTKLWDDVWSSISDDEYEYYLKVERKSIQWKRIREFVINKFGSFKNIKSIELGAGQGTYSMLFAIEGASVTILDYSKKALNLSKMLFKRHKVKANFIQMNALNIDKKLFSKFNVSMSFGTAEHFSGRKRIKIIQSHFDVLKENGLTFIAVPNKWNIIYLLWKFLSQSLGRWKFGEEYPFSILEFRKIEKRINRKFDFIGAYLFATHFNFLRRAKKLLGIKEQYDVDKVYYQIGTPLDKYLSRTIIAIGKGEKL